MKDTVIKGNGKSRSIKAPTDMPATFEEWRTQLLAGTATLDIGLNAAGCDVVGTAMSKANLLSDTTKSALELSGTDPTVNDALYALKERAVPTTRKVNGKALSADITLTAGDVGAFGMLGSSTTADLDTCKTPGCLLVHNSCANWPAGETADWGLLRIEANGSGGVVQTLTVRLTSTTKPAKAYYRMYSGDVWSVWGQIATYSDPAGYLPLGGGMMTGMLHSQIGGIGTGVGTFAGAADGLYLEAYKTNYGVRRQLVVNLIEHAPDIRNALLFNQCPNGNWESYRLYGEHNKPTPADIGALQLLTGSYVGTGVSGSGNPNSITFSRVPRLIMLLGTKTSDGEYHPLFGVGGGSYYVYLVYADMLTTAYQKGLGLSNYSLLDIYGKKSSDGKTFSWYYDATDKANYQCNASGTTYYYAALC